MMRYVPISQKMSYAQFGLMLILLKILLTFNMASNSKYMYFRPSKMTNSY